MESVYATRTSFWKEKLSLLKTFLYGLYLGLYLRQKISVFTADITSAVPNAILRMEILGYESYRINTNQRPC